MPSGDFVLYSHKDRIKQLYPCQVFPLQVLTEEDKVL